MNTTTNLFNALLLSTLLVSSSFADGNMTVEVDNGDLTVVGQNNSQQAIAIEATTVPGQFNLFSLDQTTTLNGQANLTVSGVTGDMSIDLRSGAKLLIMTEAQADAFVVAGDLAIKNKGNFDAIMLLDEVEVAGRIDIKTKNGDDVLIMHANSSGERTKINTGGGNDVVQTGFDSEFNDELEIKTGNGDDYVLSFLTNVFGQTDIRAGGQNDTIGLYSSMLGDATINGNGGVDAVEDSDNDYFELNLKSIEDDFNGGVLSMIAEARNFIPSYNDAIVLFTFFQLAD